MGKGARKAVARVITIALLLALAVGGFLAYTNRQVIFDHFAAQSFSPTSAVEDLTERLVLTEAGHRIFYASEPTLEASQHFNEQCAEVDHDEDHHVIGCFVSGKIHLFNIQDERLNGVIETTAAHELLHAVFFRMSGDEQQQLASSLRTLYDELILESPELEERMSVYTHLADLSFANELHSVFGTEIRDLPTWLEKHYAQWFSARASIVDMFEKYHAVFHELRMQAETLQEELTALRIDVEERSEKYELEAQALNQDVASFRVRIDAFEFVGDQAGFYAEQNLLLERSRALEDEYAAITTDIERYEEMRLELERLGETSNELGALLNSQLAPPLAP